MKRWASIRPAQVVRPYGQCWTVVFRLRRSDREAAAQLCYSLGLGYHSCEWLKHRWQYAIQLRVASSLRNQHP